MTSGDTSDGEPPRRQPPPPPTHDHDEDDHTSDSRFHPPLSMQRTHMPHHRFSSGLYAKTAKVKEAGGGGLYVKKGRGPPGVTRRRSNSNSNSLQRGPPADPRRHSLSELEGERLAGLLAIQVPIPSR